MTFYITPRAAALSARQYHALIMREKLGLPADPVILRDALPPYRQPQPVQVTL